MKPIVESQTQLMEWRQVNLKHKKIVEVPRPFIKWVGGKRQLLPQLSEHFPKEFKKYIELVGNKAVSGLRRCFSRIYIVNRNRVYSL